MEELLQVGAIIKTHGIRGEVKVYPLTDDVKRFEHLKEVILEPKKDNITLEITGVKYYKNLVIFLKFQKNLQPISRNLLMLFQFL